MKALAFRIARCAPWAVALAFSSVVAAGPAHAGRGHTSVAVVATFGHPAFFFNPFFFPFHPAFFRSTVFVGAPVFAPPPVAFYPPPIYYAAPPPAYYYPPPAAAPSQASAYRSEDCRSYQSTITIDGQSQPLVGTVCKGPDGNWHTVR